MALHMKIKRRKDLTANVCILAAGHHTYWKQFDGLLDKMNEKLDIFERKVKSHGVNVIARALRCGILMHMTPLFCSISPAFCR